MADIGMADTFSAADASSARDEQWAGEARSAVRYGAVLCALLLGMDALSGQLALWRGALWLGLGALLTVVLLPVRVTATTDRLIARGLWREHTVRTDLLVSVRCVDGVAQRLVLRDRLGGRVEIDPRVLVANPPLWHLLDDAARQSERRGLLLCGTTALRRLGRRVDGELAQSVFRVSGLR
ncbi:hypothetical protein [Streptomyces endophyticus]|uniref:Integral membrane protein n=1 Tax=Streptomyces endophyticus TaxID=714166 RepID=A0ABU6F4D7_9ACTN|nr:hypothetical protein [Streptomyces endophyticus]MEB8338860.1 hypothetical protein [Streptomyces endophyticus]